MRKLIRWVCLGLAVLSCQPPLFELPPRSGRTYDSGRAVPQHPAENPDEPAEQGIHLYASAVCYPDSVDWRNGEPADGQLILLRDQRELLRMPLSRQTEPDRHRIVKGQLWTDRCENGQMVVSCNGQERFRFAGEEIFNGFWVNGEQVYTLGQRPGGGICFRVNGQERFSSGSGNVLNGPDDADWETGAFSVDTGGIYYAYSLPVRVQDQVSWEYRVMKEEQTVMTIPANPDCQVYDIRVRDGIVYRVEKRGGTLCLLKGETCLILTLLVGEVLHNCKLVPVGDQMLLKGYSYRPVFTYWYREPDCLVCSVLGQAVVRELVMDGDRYAYVQENRMGNIQGVYLDQKPVYVSAGRHTLTSTRCMQFRKGTLGVALTADTGNRHMLIHNTDTVAVRFNGYFTSVLID